jgi:hypothetical protein
MVVCDRGIDQAEIARGQINSAATRVVASAASPTVGSRQACNARRSRGACGKVALHGDGAHRDLSAVVEQTTAERSSPANGAAIRGMAVFDRETLEHDRDRAAAAARDLEVAGRAAGNNRRSFAVADDVQRLARHADVLIADEQIAGHRETIGAGEIDRVARV